MPSKFLTTSEINAFKNVGLKKKSLLKFSLKWMNERDLDRPLMPIIQALNNKNELEKYLQISLKYGN
ncbi:MAG: hypothetical protein QXE19_00380 [Candidatus Bathyarchaeia archaeon]